GRIDEPRGAVDEQAQPAERALPLDPRHHVVGKPDPLAGRAENEFVRVKDEWLLRRDLNELGEVVEWPREVDEGVTARAEHAKTVVEADVDRRGLDALRVERIDPDAAGIDRRADVTIGEDHRDRVCRAWVHPARAPRRAT